MICKFCGQEVESGSFCTACGAPLEESAPVAEVTPVEETVVTETPVAEVPAEQVDPGKTLGIVSLALGIAAIVLGSICSCLLACLGGILPALMAIGGIVTGIMAMKKSKEAGFKNNLALIGIILSGVSLAVILLFIIINAIIGGINGYNAATNYYY